MPVVINGSTGISGVDGSAGTPSYQGTDTNTGIFYPAADTIAFAEGGAEIARFDSSGNLGIGVTSPDGLLTLPATASNTPKIRLQSATSDVDVTITSYADSIGTYAAFASNFYLNSTGDEAVFDSAKRSSFIRVDGRSTGAITFGTATTGVTPERMRITSGGNVGIATSNPQSGLEIYRANSTTGSLTDASLMLSTTATTGRKVNIGFGLGGGVANTCAAVIGYDVTNGAGAGLGDIFFSTRSTTADSTPTERMRIASGGQVLVNTTVNPVSSGKFAVNSGINSSTANVLELQQATDGNNKAAAAFGLAIQNGGQNTNAADLYISTASGGSLTERMRIDSSGNVLIGQTSTTGAKSEITAAGEVQYLNRDTAADGVIIRFRKQGNTVGFISTNTYTLPSDARVKTNVENIDYGLDFIEALRPVQYNTTFQDQETLSKKSFGLIAQEVEATLQEFGKSVNDVTFLEKFEPENEAESRYGLGYQNLVPVLIKAIQEQQAMIEELKAKVAALEK